jgi:hypothetical protein
MPCTDHILHLYRSSCGRPSNDDFPMINLSGAYPISVALTSRRVSLIQLIDDEYSGIRIWSSRMASNMLFAWHETSQGVYISPVTRLYYPGPGIHPNQPIFDGRLVASTNAPEYRQRTASARDTALGVKCACGHRLLSPNYLI